MTLSPTQTAILSLIRERILDEGMAPSQTEIAQALGFKSVRAAQYHLEALERAGMIERLPGRARAIRLTTLALSVQESSRAESSQDENTVRVPILGRVAAGMPIGAGSDPENEAGIALDRQCFHPFPDYLLCVQGDSMREEGILDGDLVGVQRTTQARSGQVVVARVDGEITIKQLELTATALRLLPCNADYAPITVDPTADFAIEGVYCGLLRPNRGLR